MNSADLAFAPALEQAQLVRTKVISPLELVTLYLNRIERLNPQLGSYFTVTRDLALATAQVQTAQLTDANPADLPPFFGVPIAIKDLNPVAGVRWTCGNQALQTQIAPYDDAVVTRLKQAGFIILGKTATSELGALPYTEPEGFPPARNPWNVEHTPGGSSGGSAAAVAAGLCAIAQGSDAGGSIRGPANCCGIVGLKPSRGRVSNAPMGEFQGGISTHGPLARTVTDAAALLDVMAGYVTGDPYWLPDPSVPFLAASHQPPPPLNIAYATTIPPVGTAAPDCVQAVSETVALLADLGHHLTPGCPEFEPFIAPFTTIWQASAGTFGIPPQKLGKINRWMYDRGGSSADYLRAITRMHQLARTVVAFFDTFDVLVLPTYMAPAIHIGEWQHLSPEDTFESVIRWIAPTPVFNATGQPAISLPLGISATGLPVGVQLVGRPAAEATLLSLAATLEEARPWRDRRPRFADCE